MRNFQNGLWMLLLIPLLTSCGGVLISGTVIDEDDEPVSNALVALEESDDCCPNGECSTRTNSEGEWSLRVRSDALSTSSSDNDSDSDDDSSDNGRSRARGGNEVGSLRGDDDSSDDGSDDDGSDDNDSDDSDSSSNGSSVSVNCSIEITKSGFEDESEKIKVCSDCDNDMTTVLKED